MAPARVRGCVGFALTGGTWQADASRRQNGPRKGTERCLITVRLRSKPCPAADSDGRRQRESDERRITPRHSQQAGVGSKTRSAGRVLASAEVQDGTSYRRAEVTR